MNYLELVVAVGGGMLTAVAAIYWFQSWQRRHTPSVEGSIARTVECSSDNVAIVDEHGSILMCSNTFWPLLLGHHEKVGNANLLHAFRPGTKHWWRQVVSPADFVSTQTMVALARVETGCEEHCCLLVGIEALDTNRRMVRVEDVAPFYRYNQHVHQQSELTRIASQEAPFGILIERDGRILFVNAVFAGMFELGAHQLVGLQWSDALPRESSRVIERELLVMDERDRQHTAELELFDAAGRGFWCHLVVVEERSLDYAGGYIRCWYFRDASDQKAYAQHLHQAAVVFEASSDAIMIIDATKRIKMVNSAFSRMTGFESGDILGRNPLLLGAEQKDIKRLEDIWRRVEKNGAWQGEVWKRKKDGSRYPEWLSLTAVKNSQGNINEYVAIANDMTARKQAENRIRYQANFDSLTDLPNRNLFMDRLRHGLARARREGTMLALLFVDLDRFKYINDSFGHSVGDQLLVKVAGILKGCVRNSDTIARFGGDEFAIILSPIYGNKNASRVAVTVLEKLASPVDLDGYEAVSGGSIGISLYPNDGDTEEALVKNADTAMYRAKERGRNTYQFFTDEMQQSAQARILLERDLRLALSENRLELAYQPQYSRKTGKIGGMEVLMRWSNGDSGAISPAVFISLAEDTGLIVPMGRWVLLAACEQYKRWEQDGIAPPNIAVNVSTRQFRDKNFVNTVKEVLEQTEMSPYRLELELTESMLMEGHEFAINVLEQLRAIGLKLSLDDFGTGYSSLSYLRQFPMDNLKIDQSFVRELAVNKEDLAIVTAIIDLGHTLDMQIIAEGVETPEQQNVLLQLGVDFIQGYLYSKPMNTKLCERFLRRACAEDSTDPSLPDLS